LKLFRLICVGAVTLLALNHSADAAKLWKIMPVGNSITAGVGSSNGFGFRDDLATKLTSANITFDLVGPDGVPYEGHFLSGAKIEDFMAGGAKDITPSLMTYEPNIVILHLGTNNLSQTIAPYSNNRGVTYEPTAAGRLAQLLKYLTQFSDGTKGSFLERVLVCKIIPRLDGSLLNANINLLNAEIERMFFENPPYARKTVVDMHRLLSAGDYADDRHPNDSGYAKMASEYANLISGVVGNDATAPGNPGNLLIRPENAQTAALQWTASGDDGSSGRANLYELRYATFQLTEKNFLQGKLVPLNRPSSSGATETYLVDRLVAGLTYYFALRVYDEWNQKSSIRYFSPVLIENTAGYRYCDDFSDATLPNWSAQSSYQLDIVHQDLRLKTSASASWDHLATFTGARYNSSAKLVKTSIEWSYLADAGGMNAGGIAMMLDQPSANANGYLLRLRNGVLYLNEITNGSLQTSELQKLTSTASYKTPAPGDSFTVHYFPGGLYGHVFDCYLNKTYLGQLYDKKKLQGNAAQLYSGIMLYGGNLNNAVTKFCLEVPPLSADSMQIFVGDQQRGQITQRLAEPLTVRIVDANGVPVNDVQVEFTVNSGQAFLSTDSLANNFNGHLWVEAEKGSLSGPYAAGNAVEASNAGYIYVPEDVNREKGLATYQIYNVKAGQYRLWLRVNPQDGSHNSCYLSVNGSDTLQFNFTDLYGTFKWYAYANRTFYLPQGFFELAIKNRESNTYIDKILLTNNLSYTPSGFGETTQRFSNLTDLGGLAYTFATFTTTAGPVQVRASAPAVPNGSPQLFTIYGDALDPSSMSYVSERVLSDTVGQMMDAPFSVRMLDRYNNTCVGIPVDFVVTEGDGSFGGQPSIRVSSDNQGIASARLTLGYSASGSKVIAQLPNSPEITALSFEAVPDKEGVPIEIVAIKGQDQTGIVHTALNDSLVVQVLDRNHRPVYKYPVPFKITKGNGTFNGSGATFIDSTTIYGKAHARFVLGDTAGVHNQVVTVDVPLNGAPIIFKASALADKPSLLKILSGDQQAWYAGETFPQALEVKLSDKYGNGLKGYGVKFSVVAGTGNGTLNGKDTVTVVSDSLGLARLFYTAGSQQGVNQVRVEVASQLKIPAVLFSSLTVKPPKPSRITEVSGDYQEGVVNDLLAKPFIVKVTDPFNNIIPTANLIAKVVSGGGKVNDQDSLRIQTDATGQASVTLRLGLVSGEMNQRIVIRSADYDLQPAEFIATALPGAAASVTAIGDLAFYEKPVAQAPIQVMVRDAYGNPRPGHPITFAVVSGNGHFGANQNSTQATTNASGVATANYTMGTLSTEENILNVSGTKNSGEPLSGSPITFIGRVIPGEPSQLLSRQSGEYTGKILTTLSEPLLAEVRDAYGNPVQAGVVVRFSVTAGGGSFGDAEEIDQSTDENGQARAYLRLGAVAGMNNNRVSATVPNAPQVKAIEFRASALADVPDRMRAEGDTLFNGHVKSEFNPRIQVTDLRGNAISNFGVLFKVISGGGKLRSADAGEWQDSIRVTTDLQGKAGVRWQFGDKPDSNLVNVYGRFQGSELNGSPVRFRGLATAEDPQYLRLVSAQNDTGVVRNPLADPLVVKVTDRSNNPVAGHPVLFEVIYPAAGKGKLYTAANLSDTTAQLTIATDHNGLAQVHFLLSRQVGPNYVRASSRFRNSSQALFNSPVNFYIEGLSSPAAKLLLLSSTSLTGPVRSTHDISAKAVDAFGQPVNGHPIQFQVMEESSSLDGTGNRWITVNTGNDGVATAQWTLGTVTGADMNTLRVSSAALENSPYTIKATVTPGVVSAGQSAINTTLDSVRADNISYARVTVALVDSFRNAAPGVTLTWQSEDEGVQFSDASSTTGADGHATVRVRSNRSGVKTISAIIHSGTPFTLCCSRVTFLPGEAAKMRIVSGDGLVGNVGTVLRDSLAVQVFDSLNNPIPHSVVTFTVQSGGGLFLESQKITQTDTTDAGGIARVFLILGKQVDLNNVVVASSGSIQQVITCKTRAAAAAFIYTHEGTEQAAAVTTDLTDPLVVRVEDSAGNPVWNAAVTFTPADNDGLITSANPVRTDYNGLARASYRLGNKAGDRYVTARVSGVATAATFIIHASGKTPNRIVVVSGNGQQGPAGAVLEQPFVLQVLDEYGNGVAAVSIAFRLVEGSGAKILGADTLLTDAEGKISAQVQLGYKAGDYAFLAVSSLLPDQAALFSCQALPGAAYKIDLLPGNRSNNGQSMTIGRDLLHPIIVVVLDQHNNPVKNELIQFAVVENNGYMINPKAISDDSGRVYGRWVLGETPGHNKVMAYRLGLYNSPLPFTAIGVTNHYPEFLGLPEYEQEIEYNQPWSFTLHALDADNDPLRYSLRIKPNPTNVRFDSLGNQLFQWTPTIRQKGNYQFFFTVQDPKGGLDVDSLLVKVVGDSAPVITSLYPMCGLPLAMSKPDSMVFSCTAVDYDGDPLTYRWFVNERSFSGPTFVFRSFDHPRGSLRIHVEISDGVKTTRSCEWVMLVTQVDLTSFTAAFEPFAGVRLSWRVASELNNAGFDVLRSTSEHSGFSAVTRRLIAATGTGSYEFIDSTAVAGMRYFYQLQDLSLDGSRTLHGPVQVDLALPAQFAVLQNYPNPFNPETRIRFQLPASGRTRVAVFNTLGQMVRSLADASLPAGYHEINWDGRDEQGRPVGSAVYYYRVESAGERAVKKMVLLR